MSLDRPPGDVGALRIVLGVSRGRVLPLRVAYQGHDQIRVVATCSTASEVLSAVVRERVDAVVVDEDLHGLDRARLSALNDCHLRVVVLSRQPTSSRWERLSATVLPTETDPLELLRAVQQVPGARLRGGATRVANGRPRSEALKLAASGRSTPRASTTVGSKKSQVVAFWSGRGSPGKTTIGVNSLAIEGAVEPTVLVELETTAASLVAYLDDGRDGHPRRAGATLLDIAGALPRSSADWDKALKSLQPLGDYSPHARLLCGVAHPEQRFRLADPVSFVEAMIDALRRHFARVLLDVGSDPVSSESIEACVASTALRLADVILVVATPDPASVHRTCMAISEAGDRLDRPGVGLVINRLDPKFHGDVSWISNAVGLPIIALLPADDRAQRRAIRAALPAVRDPDSRVRRPLTALLEQLGSPPEVGAFVPEPRPHRSLFIRPAWGKLCAALSFVPTAIGGTR